MRVIEGVKLSLQFLWYVNGLGLRLLLFAVFADDLGLVKLQKVKLESFANHFKIYHSCG